jgi:hypothetical protein
MKDGAPPTLDLDGREEVADLESRGERTRPAGGTSLVQARRSFLGGEVMKKFYLFWGAGTGAEIKEFYDEDAMLEFVRLHQQMYDRLPTVYFGTKLEFEPAEVVKSWKVKETR